jgi:hypothetical protein
MSRVTRKTSDGRIQLSPNFYLDQFLPAGANPPAPTVIQNLFRLAARLEREPQCLVELAYVDPLNRPDGIGLDSPHLRGAACRYLTPGAPGSITLTLEE